MSKFIYCVFGVIFSASIFFSMTPAQAQATRTWVSGVGDDVNPCSRTAPCKTFAGAISKTATRGEINCLDSGGFGAVTIIKSISIVCNGVIGGVLAAGTNGINVNLAAATDRVTLQGLDIDGAGTGLDGVRMLGSGALTILKTTIRGFTGDAVDLSGTAARVVLDDVYLGYNFGGVAIQNPSNYALMNDVFADTNSSFSVKVCATCTVVLSDSYMAGSSSSISAAAGATVISYGTNVIRNFGVPTQTLPLK
jgi:hypothetical protein